MDNSDKKVKKIINRAFANNRPNKAFELRKVDNSLKSHPCNPQNTTGHDYRFYPFDRYGCCKKCGDEILV